MGVGTELIYSGSHTIGIEDLKMEKFGDGFIFGFLVGGLSVMLASLVMFFILSL